MGAFMNVFSVAVLSATVAGCGSGGGGAQPTTAGQAATAPEAISVKVAAPADGSIVRDDRVVVRGTVDPPDAEVRVLGQPAQVGNGVFTAAVPVHRGSNAIDIVVSAPGVAPATLTVTVRRPEAGGSKSSDSESSDSESSNPPPSSSSSGSVPIASSTNCGGGLTAGPNTSCPFAENVRAAYQQTGSAVLDVYSPVTGRTYTMYCTGGSTHVCTGGNNATVYFGDATGYSTRDCGNGISAGPNTSCAFASNVRDEYYRSGAGVISVYSPVTGRSYTMYCTSGSPHACTGGNNAAVYFP